MITNYDNIPDELKTTKQWVRDGKIKAVQYANRGKWYIPESEINRIRSGKKD